MILRPINEPKSKEVRASRHSCVDPYLTSDTITIYSIKKIYRDEYMGARRYRI